jgi:hypothetical protein
VDLRRLLETSLGAQFRVERELDGAGMSRVFVAEEVALSRKVVIKTLPPDLVGSLSAERFARETRLAAALQHPNIVPVLSAGQADGVPYYTMPFIDGESLHARLKRTGALSLDEALPILRDVLRALHYAHSQGVVHRDVKPDNVLLAADYAVLTDLGIAKAMIAARSNPERLTAVGGVIGTPAYMAPEQIAADDIDHRADLYSFGCMAYEMVAGRPPFTERRAAELFAAHTTRTPPPLAALRPELPAPFAALVMRCLEKKPDARPADAREVLSALEGQRPLAHRRTLKRWTLPVTVAGIGIAIAAAVAIWPSADDVSSDLIAVTPFRISGADASLRVLREGMVDLVHAKLTGGVRAVDQRTVLSEWRRAGGTESADVPESEALAMSRRLRAGLLLQGDIVGSADALTLSATLKDSRDGSLRAAATVRGPLSSAAVLVDSLVGTLFVQHSGYSGQQARALAGISWAALEPFLIGQRLYRRGQYRESEKQFIAALDADSTFALAGVQLFVNAGWTNSDAGERGRIVALRGYDRLSPRERIGLRGIQRNYLDGYRRDCMDYHEAGKRAAQLAPEVPETWYFVADPLFHCGATITPDPASAHRDALAALERGVAIDSSFVPLRTHLPWLYLLAGDTASALKVLQRERRDSVQTADLTAFVIGLMPDSNERRSYVDSLIRTRDAFASDIPDLTTPFAVYQDDVERLLHGLKSGVVTDVERREVAAIERRWALNRGQPTRALSTRRAPSGAGAALITDYLFWDGDSTVAANAYPSLQLAIDEQPSAGERGAWSNRVFAASQFALATGDVALARRGAGVLAAQTPDSGRPWSADYPRSLAIVLDAQVTAAERSPAAFESLRSLDSLVRRGTGGWPLTIGALVASRLWQQRGDLRNAYIAIQRMFPEETMFLSTYRLERARIAAALGERKDALEQYRLYLAMRSRPEAALMSQVTAVRAEYDRLLKRAR